MTYRGHTVTGAIASVATWRLTGLHAWPMLLLIASIMFGAFAPDFDHPAAFMSRRVPGVHWLVRLTLSNPISWLLVGDGSIACRPGRWKVMEWLCCNYLTCKVLGKNRAERLRNRSVSGRKCVIQMMGHRGLSHSVLGTMVAMCMTFVVGICGACGLERLFGLQRSVVLWHGYMAPVWLPWLLLWTLGFGVGYLVHIASDMVTVSGVRLGQPWSSRSYWLLPKNMRLRVR